MRINIEATNFDADKKLIEYINNKIEKLTVFYDRIVFVDVFLKVQKTSEKENKVVEVLLSIPGNKIVKKKQSKTFEEGVVECVKALERALKKTKQKQK